MGCPLAAPIWRAGRGRCTVPRLSPSVLSGGGGLLSLGLKVGVVRVSGWARNRCAGVRQWCAGRKICEWCGLGRAQASAIAPGGGMLEHCTPLATLALLPRAHLPIKGDSLYGLGPTQFALRFGLPPPASLPGYIKPPRKRKRDGLFYGPLAWKPPVMIPMKSIVHA